MFFIRLNQKYGESQMQVQEIMVSCVREEQISNILRKQKKNLAVLEKAEKVDFFKVRKVRLLEKGTICTLLWRYLRREILSN